MWKKNLLAMQHVQSFQNTTQGYPYMVTTFGKGVHNRHLHCRYVVPTQTIGIEASILGRSEVALLCYYPNRQTIKLYHFCSYNVVKSETHFVLKCPLYNSIRIKIKIICFALLHKVTLCNFKSTTNLIVALIVNPQNSRDITFVIPP